LPGFDDGSLRPIVETVLPLEQAAKAHQILEANANVGKVVLRVG
jgi:NADPH:quinone reductase-like Zn-dependent oxidoreductase